MTRSTVDRSDQFRSSMMIEFGLLILDRRSSTDQKRGKMDSSEPRPLVTRRLTSSSSERIGKHRFFSKRQESHRSLSFQQWNMCQFGSGSDHFAFGDESSGYSMAHRERWASDRQIWIWNDRCCWLGLIQLIAMDSHRIHLIICYALELNQSINCAENQTEHLIFRTDQQEIDNDTIAWLQSHCSILDPNDFVVNDDPSNVFRQTKSQPCSIFLFSRREMFPEQFRITNRETDYWRTSGDVRNEWAEESSVSVSRWDFSSCGRREDLRSVHNGRRSHHAFEPNQSLGSSRRVLQ